MTEPRIHYQDRDGAPWAACSASIHGHRYSRKTRDVTCQACLRRGRPKYARRWWGWWR